MPSPKKSTSVSVDELVGGGKKPPVKEPKASVVKKVVKKEEPKPKVIKEIFSSVSQERPAPAPVRAEPHRSPSS